MKEADSIDNNVEQSTESVQPPTHISRDDLSEVHSAANKLVEALESVEDGHMIAEMVANSLKLLRDNTNRGDIKLINKSFKELRYALKIFAPYRETHKVSIFGSARTPESSPDYIAAAEFGKKMVAAGWMVITGAGGGIMAAGHGGAGAEPSFGLAIRLPFEQETNTFIANDPKLINFKYFFTRKLMFLRSSSAIVCFPGGFGTMDEGFEVLTLVQTGKSVPCPIVMVDHKGGQFWKAWHQYVIDHLLGSKLISEEDLHLYKVTDNVDEAVAEVTTFYKNYHSVRYNRDELIMRIQKAPNAEQLAHIQKTWASICPSGTFRVSAALPLESDEPSLSHLPRLIFTFNRREHGKLRMLINYLNSLV